MEALIAAIGSSMPSILSGIAIGALGWLGRSMVGFKKEHNELLQNNDKLDKLLKEHEALMESQRNQIKASIVEIYERASLRGYITPMELDTVNRLADSYFALGGNHYIHAVMWHINHEMPVVGDPIPDEIKEQK